jgi:hypothetical protein
MKVLWRPTATIVQTVILAILNGGFLSLVVIRSSHAAPVDDSRMMQLEQEVRALQRLVDQQARRIDSLESAMRQPRTRQTPTPISTPVKSSDAGAWLKSGNWDKLQIGMPVNEVVGALGPPITVRKAENGTTQTLFYTLELEAGGFLSGHVVIVDERVLEIHKPALR